MRLYLLPISTRRTLIYCQRLNVATAKQQNWLDKGRTKAANLWADWEKKDSGWQRKVVDYGNQALKRIPFEEWGLKSIPPLSQRRQKQELSGNEKAEIVFPSTLIPEKNVLKVLGALATERQGLHKRRLVWSIVGMPIVAPFAIVPVIPNLPFFYLVFRAWSHWAALSGSRHLEFLLDKKLVTLQPSRILDKLYSPGKTPSPATDERMVLRAKDIRPFADDLKIPELYIELSRAVWQVEKAIKAEKELKEEKAELESARKKGKQRK